MLFLDPVQRRLSSGLVVLAFAWGFAGCGDSAAPGFKGADAAADGKEAPWVPAAEFTAKVNGVPWQADPRAILAQADRAPGSFVVSGASGAGYLATTLTFRLQGVTGPGEYPLGPGWDL